jgi:hypothetical protein
VRGTVKVKLLVRSVRLRLWFPSALLAMIGVLGVVGCFGGRATGGGRNESRAHTTNRAVVDEPRGCPRNDWPGPWKACAEARWVRRIVEVAGYRVTDEPASALVAKGKGREFYIWTSELTRPFNDLVSAEGWRRIATVDGAHVYGDQRLWRFWAAQVFIFWIQAGPRARSVAPRPTELGPLIRASKSIQPPPRRA